MNIPIIQGVAVSPQQTSAYQKQPQQPSSQQLQQGGGGGYYGQSFSIPTFGKAPDNFHTNPPPRQFRDVIWALLFVTHLVVLLVVISMGLSNVDLSSGGAYSHILFLVSVSAVSAVVFSTFALSFMMINTGTLVQIALIYSVLMSLAIGVMGFLMGSILMGCLGMLSFCVGLCYAKAVWPRIPFAASNLRAALTAVRANLGVVALAYGSLALAFGWTVLWFLGVGQSLQEQNLALVFALFVSYYWVHEVLQNTMQVTTAGVIGTWWFVTDEANSCCSRAVSDSFVRSTTYSFGSICLGSLLVALVKALRSLEHYTRDNDDFQFLSCILQCLLSCLESILEEINRWAYVYVGLYGFSFLEAGRNVITLFEQKGWSVIITDDLCENVLSMMSMAVGLGTGLVGMIFGLLDPDMLAGIVEDDGTGVNAVTAGFLIGGLVGLLFSSVVFAVVGSAVNTVIVCYCEAPGEFQRNHPQLSADMRSSWVQAYPQLF